MSGLSACWDNCASSAHSTPQVPPGRRGLHAATDVTRQCCHCTTWGSICQLSNSISSSPYYIVMSRAYLSASDVATITFSQTTACATALNHCLPHSCSSLKKKVKVSPENHHEHRTVMVQIECAMTRWKDVSSSVGSMHHSVITMVVPGGRCTSVYSCTTMQQNPLHVSTSAAG